MTMDAVTPAVAHRAGPGEDAARPIERAVILGGGNAARALAADFALRGLEVRILEFPGRASRLAGVSQAGVIGVVRDGVRTEAPVALVTQDPATAVAGIDIVVVAVPAFAHRAFAELLAPHLTGSETILVFTAALGGLEFRQAARRIGREHAGPIVEVENLPYTCRVAGPVDVVIHLDVPQCLAGVYPASATDAAARRVGPLVPGMTFGRDLLEPLLTNMNGVVHPPVVLMNVPTMERARGEPWWVWEVGVTPSVARVVERLDEERLAVGSRLGLSLDPVADLMWRSGYGPRGSIYEVINGCAAMRKVRGPVDLAHRWFVEDIPYILALWADLARHCGVPVPLMESLCGLAGALLGRDVAETGRKLADVGLGGRDAAGIRAGLAVGIGAP